MTRRRDRRNVVLGDPTARVAASLDDAWLDIPHDDIGSIEEIFIRLRQMEEADRDEQETLLDLYRRAIGMDAGPETSA